VLINRFRRTEGGTIQFLFQKIAPRRRSTVKRGAVFDLDGTLADTSADLIRAANIALGRMRSAGRLDPARDQGVAGRGGRAMLRLGLERSGQAWTEADVDAIFPDFLRDYEAVLAEETRLFDGVADCLDLLIAEGWALGVCTNKPERLARLLLAELGVAARFAAILGADTLPVRKPDPLHLWETVDRIGAHRAASVLIGDTVTDRATATNAGAPCVLVDFGLSAEDPRSLAPEAIITHFRDLPAALNRLARTA
jgi:phosphoglycolate phosphatase